MTHVPQAWTALVGHHRAAQVSYDQARNRDLPQSERDAATIRHGRALDAMFADMNALSEAGITGKLTLLFARTGAI